MELKEILESGLLEDYCLGLLNDDDSALVNHYADQYPEIKKEIAVYEKNLEQLAGEYAQQLPHHLKASTLDIIEGLSKENAGTISEKPLLTKYSDPANWLRIVRPQIPSILEKDFFFKVIRDDEEVFQTILWVKKGYPDEVHDDCKECFMILEGECECHVGDDVIELGPGDFFDVPLHLHHDVKVTKGPVLALVQRLKKVA